METMTLLMRCILTKVLPDVNRSDWWLSIFTSELDERVLNCASNRDTSKSYTLLASLSVGCTTKRICALGLSIAYITGRPATLWDSISSPRDPAAVKNISSVTGCGCLSGPIQAVAMMVVSKIIIIGIIRFFIII